MVTQIWVERPRRAPADAPGLTGCRGERAELSGCRRRAVRPGVPVRRAGGHRGRAGTARDPDRHGRGGPDGPDRAGGPRRVGSLDLWWLGSYGGGLFLPIRDADPRTYGGGRYLLDTIKGADLGGDADGLVVDLNFAYQPSCAYDEAWACPLAGPTNTVPVPVPVGERYRAVPGT